MCFPRAGIGNVSDRLEAGMAGEGTKPIVCLSVTGNNVGCVGSEKPFRRFRKALGKIKDRGLCNVWDPTRASS